VSETGGRDWDWRDGGGDTWDLTLPTSSIEHVAVTANAGRITATLPGATIGSLGLTRNGAEILADLSSASIAELDGSVDFGRLAIQLPRHGGYSGAIRMSAGELRLCVPYALGLHVDFAGSPREVRVNGLRTEAQSWENDLYQSTTNRAELSVKGNFRSLTIEPQHG